MEIQQDFALGGVFLLYGVTEWAEFVFLEAEEADKVPQKHIQL